MREEEARTKWCPMVRCAGDGSAFNTDTQTPMAPFYMCRGSDCMMWHKESYADEGTGNCSLKNKG